jgi:hypothetical protein
MNKAPRRSWAGAGACGIGEGDPVDAAAVAEGVASAGIGGGNTAAGVGIGGAAVPEEEATPEEAEEDEATPEEAEQDEDDLAVVDGAFSCGNM